MATFPYTTVGDYAVNEEIKKLIDAIGASCEMAGVYLVNLMENGFTRTEAVAMTTAILISMIKGNGYE